MKGSEARALVVAVEGDGRVTAATVCQIPRERASFAVAMTSSTQDTIPTTTFSPKSAHAQRVFDHRQVFDTTVQGKTIVYLDTNVWAELADSKTPQARECLDRCQRAVERGTHLFPLSGASIREVMGQPPEANPLRQAQVMDRLSGGVTFRAPHILTRLEAGYLAADLLGLPFEGVSPRDLYSALYEYVGDGYLDFPQGFPEDKVPEFLAYFRSLPACHSVAAMLQELPCDRMRAYHKARLEAYVREMEEVVAAANQRFVTRTGDVNKDKIHVIEKASYLTTTLIPLARDIIETEYGQAGLARLRARLSEMEEGSSQRVREVMLHMPTQELYCRMMAVIHWNKARKVNAQDFYDMEHATAGACYADSFVTLDGGLRDLLRQCKLHEVSKTKVLGSLQELVSSLGG